MRLRLWPAGIALVLTAAAAGLSAQRRAASGVPGSQVKWQKIVLDKEFRAEGVAVADVNRDGKPDILAGNFWYEAPNWTPHEIRPAQKFDPEHGYSNAFMTFAMDVNGDGWPDEIVVGFPGDKCLWYENPGKTSGAWKDHVICTSACNESPNFAPLLGNRKPYLVFPFNESQVAWYEPGPDPTKEWEKHIISTEKAPGCNRFSHGLGVGDVTGDGRPDVLCKDGFWEAPRDPRTGPWKWVPANLGPDCAYMHVYDFNGDGLPDVVSSSAHNKGIWWYEQKAGGSAPTFVQHLIDDSFSQSHSLCMADINGDGKPDLITGKRWWAHGPTGDVEPNNPAVLVWYEFQGRSEHPAWTKHVIDEDSGVGTQFQVADINRDGLPDIAISNKKGVFVFIQQRN